MITSGRIPPIMYSVSLEKKGLAQNLVEEFLNILKNGCKKGSSHNQSWK